MGLKQTVNQKLHNFCFILINTIQRIVFNILDCFRPSLRNLAEYLLSMIGVTINGPNPYDVKVNDERCYALVISSGFIGVYDCIVEKYVEVEDYELIMDKVLQNKTLFILFALHPYNWALGVINRIFDVQTVENSWKDGGEQYDYGINLYKASCGPKMLYSCLNFDETNDIAEAEIHQMELIAKKLNLKPGMTVLDIGCGFGTLSEYLASHYDVSVTGVTNSKDMKKYATEKCKGLKVNIQCKDYREVEGKFDRITCIEMSEHVGSHHYRSFIVKVQSLLNDDGLFLLQVVTNNTWFMDEYNAIFEKHLGLRVTFPQIKNVVKDTNGYFIVEHVENIGYYYGLTWSVWLKNFKQNWPKISHLYDERFYRNWCFYFASGSSLFRNRIMHVHQLVLSKNGVNGKYRLSN